MILVFSFILPNFTPFHTLEIFAQDKKWYENWTEESAYPFSFVDETDAATIDNKIYVFNGNNRNINNFKNLFVYDVTSKEWTQKQKLPWITSSSSQKYYIKSITHDSKIYLLVSNEVKTVNDIVSKLYVFDTKTETFQNPITLTDSLSPSGKTLPNRRQYSEMTIVNNKLYILGGRTFDGGEKILFNNMEVYDLITKQFTSNKKIPQDLTSYENFYSFTDNQSLFVVDSINHKVYKYSDENDNWSYSFNLVDNNENNIFYNILNNGMALNNKLYLLLGDRSQDDDSLKLMKYDLETNQMQNITSFERESAFRVPYLITNSRIYTYGGDTKNIYSYFLSEITDPTDPGDGAPTLTLKSNKDIYNIGENAEITIEATSNDGDVALKATANGEEVEIHNNKITINSNKESTIEIEVTATDKKGNSTTKKITIVFVKENSGSSFKLIVSDGKLETEINKEVIIKINGATESNKSEIKLLLDDKEVLIDNSFEYKFTPTKMGLYSFKLIKSSDSKTIDSFNLTVIDPLNNQLPEVTLNELNPNVVTEPTNVLGTVTETGLVKYTLSYSKADENNFIVFKESSKAITNGVVGVIDPTVLNNGFYKFRLTAYGSTKNTYKEILVSVEGNMKLGNFSMDFKDMDIPVLNFPLTVIRGYDSRNRMISGDFGHGWNLNMNSAKISESTSPHENWVQKESGSWIKTYRIEETKKHEVSIDWGNGRVDKWAFKMDPMQQSAARIQYVTAQYSPVTKTKDKLEALDFPKDLLYNDDKLYTYSLQEFRPERFKLTKEDGTVIVFNKKDGIETITDTASNVITFSKDGVTHSDGKSIVFTRDSENRITKITDPNGKNVSYKYDDSGDLIEVTDIGGQVTKFEYDNKHYLTSIIDPRGITAGRNEYDENGRLVATVDAKGNRTEYTHDLENKQEIIKDKLGNITTYEYDKKGNTISISDALGNKTTYTYDTNNNLSSVTDHMGYVTKYHYSEEGYLQYTIDPEGTKRENKYDSKKLIQSVGIEDKSLSFVYNDYNYITEKKTSSGDSTFYDYDQEMKLNKISDEIGIIKEYIYDSNARVIGYRDADNNYYNLTYDEYGNVTSKSSNRATDSGYESYLENYQYDNNGNLIKITYPEGRFATLEYNEIGLIISKKDSRGQITNYEYDLFGNLIKVSYPNGKYELMEYDILNRLVKITDIRGLSTKLQYDSVGNITKLIEDNGNSTIFQYDSNYEILSKEVSTGQKELYKYDSIGNNTEIKDSYGNTTKFSYNELSLLSSMTDAKGNVYNYKYDDNGNLIETIYPDDTVTKSIFDSRDRLIENIDQYGFSTKYGYDSFNNLTYVVDSLGHTWKYGYNENSLLTSITDPKNNITKYIYDINGRIVETTNPLGKIESIKYDDINNKTTTTDFAEIKISKKFLDNGLVSEKTYGDLKTNYIYNNNDMLKQATHSGKSTFFTYDDEYNVKSAIHPNGQEIKYDYLNGNISSITSNYGNISYEYDLEGRIIVIEDNDKQKTLFNYDANGNLALITYSNGMKISYDYDKLNRLIYENVKDKNNLIINDYKYTLGKYGQKLQTEEASGKIVKYSYDKLYRLTEEKHIFKNTTDIISYSYDELSNMVQKNNNGSIINYTYNELNQLIKENDIVYRYDLNGNRIEKKSTSETINYTYDKSNKLISVSINKNGVVSTEIYEYDYLGNRVSKSVNGKKIEYLIDYNSKLTDVIAEIDTSTNTLNKFYTRGNGILINMKVSQDKFFYIQDGNGSVRMLIDDKCKVTDTYDYDGYGNIITKTGTTDNDFLYCSEQFDQNTNLYYLRARYMNPESASFMTMDAYTGTIFDPPSLHRYLYAKANPIMYSDPSGYSYTLAGQQGVLAAIAILSGIAVLSAYSILKDLYRYPISMSIPNLVQDGLVGNPPMPFPDVDDWLNDETLKQLLALLALMASIQLINQLPNNNNDNRNDDDDNGPSETYYRIIPTWQGLFLKKTNILLPRTETMIATDYGYYASSSTQYKGTLYQINTYIGAYAMMYVMGVKEKSNAADLYLPNMPYVSSGWKGNYFLFKYENGDYLNIGLGDGVPLFLFNAMIKDVEKLDSPYK